MNLGLSKISLICRAVFFAVLSLCILQGTFAHVVGFENLTGAAKRVIDRGQFERFRGIPIVRLRTNSFPGKYIDETSGTGVWLNSLVITDGRIAAAPMYADRAAHAPIQSMIKGGPRHDSGVLVDKPFVRYFNPGAAERMAALPKTDRRLWAMWGEHLEGEQGWLIKTAVERIGHDPKHLALLPREVLEGAANTKFLAAGTIRSSTRFHPEGINSLKINLESGTLHTASFQIALPGGGNRFVRLQGGGDEATAILLDVKALSQGVFHHLTGNVPTRFRVNP